MKKFIVVVLLLVIVLSTVGCAKITYERKHTLNSSVVDRLTFELDREELSAYGYSLDYAKEVIRSYLSYYDFEIVESEEDHIVVYERVYETMEEFNRVNGSSEEEEADKTLEDLFFLTSESEGDTPFRHFIVNDMDAIWSELFPNVSEECVAGIEYVYKYGTPYESVESNADLVYESEDGLYTHEWKFNTFSAKEGIIKIKQTVLNATGWYIVAIAIGLIVSAAGFLISEKVIKEDEESKDGRKKAN